MLLWQKSWSSQLGPMVSQFEEKDDTVSFILYIVGTDPVTKHEVAVSTRTMYRFRDDKVVEVWQEDPAAVEAAVRATGEWI